MAKSNPWDQRPEESARAYEAARIYFELGADRTHQATRARLGRKSGYLRVLEGWSGRNAWVDRARAYDDHHARIDADAKERAARLRAGRWADRLDQDREANWVLGNAAREQAGQQLQAAKGQKQPIKPSDLKSLVDSLLAASKLTAQAVAPNGVVDPAAPAQAADDAADQYDPVALDAARKAYYEAGRDAGPD